MKTGRGSSRHLEWDSGRKIRIKTTMNDLVGALNDEIKAGEEALVPFMVLDMMERGLLRFVKSPKG